MAFQTAVPDQPRNLVVCCDGTGNEVETDLSNVLKFYRVAVKSEQQVVFYHPGVGTLGLRSGWGQQLRKIRGVWGLATGAGLNANILEAYTFLARAHRPGDRIFLLGFSRGAYTVRALAGFIHMIGLLRPEQLNLCDYALNAYLQADSENDLEVAWRFQRTVDGRRVPIHFMGVWDTVASVLVPRARFPWVPKQQHLPYTKQNPSVRTFRQACAIDERRRMFRLYNWRLDQKLAPDAWPEAGLQPRDAKQVWFAGVHADVGGGYSEAESQLAKFPLQWMIGEAEHAGLLIDRSIVERLVLGSSSSGKPHEYVSPDHQASAHDSLTLGWRPLEWLPKRLKWRRWPAKTDRTGWYLPRAEPRYIPEGAHLHKSVSQRLVDLTTYKPVNLPDSYEVES
ncbi:MAG TPA: DUF2235 domain-containing protein [Allosphingosinicella sp.]|jgi:uncharacterized protein (DUF2235 family)|uniref:DUF2235 domain-containing protein n=1 Tax=Allosphingosinicella sp. TaxID=2823234 RepID=UPI002F287C7F